MLPLRVQRKTSCSTANTARVAQALGWNGPSAKKAAAITQAIAQSMKSAATRRPKRAIERGPDSVPDDPLTPRESEVVKLIAEGLTSREIADTLVISEKTVERHRANVLEKLGLRDRVALTRYAIRRGLVEP